MKQEKTIEVLRNRNAKLQEELGVLKKNDAKSADGSKNKGIKKQWQDALDDLKVEKVKYTELIKDMRSIKKTFKAV